GEQNGDLLALALQGGLRDENLLSQVLRRVAFGRDEAGRPRRGRGQPQARPTAAAELVGGLHAGTAPRADSPQSPATLIAELCAVGILRVAPSTLHQWLRHSPSGVSVEFRLASGCRAVKAVLDDDSTVGIESIGFVDARRHRQTPRSVLGGPRAPTRHRRRILLPRPRPAADRDHRPQAAGAGAVARLTLPRLWRELHAGGPRRAREPRRRRRGIRPDRTGPAPSRPGGPVAGAATHAARVDPDSAGRPER